MSAPRPVRTTEYQIPFGGGLDMMRPMPASCVALSPSTRNVARKAAMMVFETNQAVMTRSGNMAMYAGS